MKREIFQHRIRFHAGIATVFVVLVAALTGVIIWNNHHEATKVAEQTADQLFLQIANGVDERMNGMLGAVKATVDVASALPSLAERPNYDGLASAPLEAMIRLFEARPYIYSFFVGHASGEWLQIVAPRGDVSVASAFKIPEEAELLVRTISLDREEKSSQYLRYLNHQRQVVAAQTTVEPDYDPRSRGWYQDAIAAENTIFSDPFVFFRLQRTGITASRRLAGGSGVVGVAITLSNFSRFLGDLNISQNARVMLVDSKQRILASYQTEDTVPNSKDTKIATDEASELQKLSDLNDPIFKSVLMKAMEASRADPQTQRLEVDGKRYLARVQRVGLQLGLDQYVAIVAPHSDFTSHIAQMQRRSIVAALVALAIALPIIYLAARRVAAKLATLAEEANRMRRFELGKPLELESFFLEVHNLSLAFGAMKKAVNVFGRYVPRALVQKIVQSGVTPELGGKRQEISVLFTDIENFTRISEDTLPEELMHRTSEYFETLGHVLSRHHGIVDKYIGDAIMALWNAPDPDELHVIHACIATLECREASRSLADEWQAMDIPPFKTRFGLHCGEAVVGNVGGADRIDFTAVGNTINLASRLEGLNKQYGTEILVSETVAKRVEGQCLIRRIDRVQPVGVGQATNIYELIAVLKADLQVPEPLIATPEQVELVALWESAERHYINRNWESAAKDFEQLLNRYPNDAPSKLLLKRCKSMMDGAADEDWDGVTRLSRK